jgi:hypothetical protein
MTTESTTATPAPASGDIVARAGRYYRNTRYLMFLMILGFGIAFLYDGFYRYPKQNAELASLESEQKRATTDEEKRRLAVEIKKHEYHNDTSLLIQKLLGFALPPLAIALLAWSLHRSRGEYRLSGTKLSVPGHPTVDLDEIKSVNNDLWDRKGIVWLKYETAKGEQGEIVLDDFIYDRPPTDQIYDRIAEKFGLNEDEEDEDDEDDDDETERKEEAESSDAQT